MSNASAVEEVGVFLWGRNAGLVITTLLATFAFSAGVNMSNKTKGRKALPLSLLYYSYTYIY